MDTFEYMEQSHQWAAKHLPDEEAAYHKPPRRENWRKQRDVVHGRHIEDALRELGLLHDGSCAE